MIKTFVYGTPHGFDFYEKDVAYTDYFKSFYISSRKGRRLMVNRKEDGETTYNYLCYGLREAVVRPNSFFGMTVVLDSNSYSSDFNRIIVLFDHFFEKILNEKHILKKNEEGEIQYVVNKFSDNAKDVEWIKINLPKIFSSAAGTSISYYDSSFVPGKTGQIPCLNDKQSDSFYLSIFKNNYWITLSKEFEKQDEKVNSNSLIELSYPDLKKQFDEYNKRLVPIATGINQGSAKELALMYENAKTSFSILHDYIKAIKGVVNVEEFEMFESLTNDYSALVESISALLSKRVGESNNGSTPPKRPTKEQYCYICKQYKDVSHFQSPSSIKCIECEQSELGGDRKTKKRCDICGEFKFPEEYSNGSNICLTCEEKLEKNTKICRCCKKRKSLKDFPQDSDLCQECTHKWKIQKYILISILSIMVLIAIGVGLYHFFDEDQNGKQVDSPTENVAKAIDDNQRDSVSIEKLKKMLDNGQFDDAYKFVNDNMDSTVYMPIIIEAIDNMFWKAIDESNSSDKETIRTLLEVKFTPLSSLLSQLKVGDDFMKKIYEGAGDYARLQTILTKRAKITKGEYDEGCDILKRIGIKLPSKWDKVLLSKWEASTAIETNGEDVIANHKGEKASENKVTPGPVSLSYTKPNGIEENIEVTGNRGFDAKPGTQVTVSYPNGKIYYEGKKDPFLGTKTITLNDNPDKTMRYIFKCDNVVITITINPLDYKPKRH